VRWITPAPAGVSRCTGDFVTGARGPAAPSLTDGSTVLNRDRLPITAAISRYRKTLCAFLLFLVASPLYAVPAGTLIQNTASAQFDIGAATGITVNSNTVNVTTTIVRTSSTVSLLQYLPSVPTVNEETPSQCRSGAGGPFVASANPQYPDFGSTLMLDPSTPLPLALAPIFHMGEPIFVRVTDNDQNVDALVADTVSVLMSDTGDSEEVLLTETGVNTGIFIGYIQSTNAASAPFDCLLTVSEDSMIQAVYTDVVDGSDSASAATLVDPFGVVFNSQNGQPVNGVTVRLINATTGLPAVPGTDIFGNDGVSAFPNTLVSGGTATDSGGTVYNFPAGMYRFPLLPPGNYRLELVPPGNYTAPSSAAIAQLQSLPGAPFALLSDASFGQDFTLNPGPPLHVDIPIDPLSSQLVLEKSASTRGAAVGDFVQYRLILDNVDTAAAAANVVIDDVLPQGFRYRAGSLRINAAAASDPAIAADGRSLQLNAGTLPPGGSVNLTYVTEVSAGAVIGDAVNRARARDQNGTVSNEAAATVEVSDELMRDKNILVGRVLAGNCPLTAPGNGSAEVRLVSTRQDEHVNYSVEGAIRDARVSNYWLVIELPEPLRYEPGSAMLDGYALADPIVEEGRLVFRFDDRLHAGVGEWRYRLNFSTRLNGEAWGRFVTGAWALMDTATEPQQRTPIAKNILLRKQPQIDEKHFVFRPVFSTLDASLEPVEKEQLDRIIKVISDVEIVEVDIGGHTDNRPISSENRDFENNFELSQARARTIAPYFQAALALDPGRIHVHGFGDAQPIADNGNETGRAWNRRVDIAINARVATEKGVDEIIVADSGTVNAQIRTDRDNRKTAEVGPGLRGVKGVRLYMEDGTYAVTDENGKYHIEGVRPGTHVVQLDTGSLPAGYRAVACERNTRFAGKAHSQFVDLKPGTLWRVDFHVEEQPAVMAEAKLHMQTLLNEGMLHYTISNQGGKVGVSNYQLTVILPEGAAYVAGSSRVSGNAVEDPQVSDPLDGSILVYRLGELPPDWDRNLQFDARVPASVHGKLVSKAAAIMDAGTTKGLRIPPVETVAMLDDGGAEPRRYVFQPRFNTLYAELNTQDKRELDALMPQLLGLAIREIRVIGHTDNVPISAAGRKKFADNHALSLARAQTVARYLQEMLDLPESVIRSEGRGPDEPVASNATAEGRAQNRRTEIVIEAVATESAEIRTMVEPESTVSSVAVPVTVPAQGGGSSGRDATPAGFKRPPSTAMAIEQFDERWLETAAPGVAWLMPSADHIPAIPAVNIAIKHRPGDAISASLNGKPLNPLFYFGLKKNIAGTVARSYWQGVHLKEGENFFEFNVRGADGSDTVLSRVVHYSDAPVRAELAAEHSYLVADGKNPPVLAVRFYDRWNKPVRPGVIGHFAVLPPYQSKERLDAMEEDLLSAFDRSQPLYEIEEHGIAYIELEPTAQTGKAVLQFHFSSGKEQKIESWLKPAAREWIVVGLADAVIGANSNGGDITAAERQVMEDGSYRDGKLAFFAKGNLNEDWLLTASADSSRERDATGSSLFQTVDPDEFFTLYGDSTEQRYEASSADKMYVKLERDRFYTLYGDYETGLNATELSKYVRSVTGLKSEYQGGLFSFNGFAAETTQRFARDEIQGNGTSGLYRLSRGDIVLNSETITIETRDRFHSQDIVEQRILRRHHDYNIDYRAGTIFFREPVTSRDRNFNHVFIVADYEVETDIENDVTGGGRGAFSLAGGNLELGISAISDGTFAQSGELYGMDAKLKLGGHSELKLEYAGSEVDDAGLLREGDVYLAELSTHGEKLDSRVYVREQQDGFGLGQQSGGEAGTGKYGVDASYRIIPGLTLNSEIFHEDNLLTDAQRDVAEVSANYAFDSHTVSAGYRNAEDELGNGDINESELLLVGGSTRVYDNKLNLRLNSELALDSNDANPAYPTRHIAGADYFWTPNLNTYVEQELTEGEYRDTSSTRIGMQARPWEQARLDTRLEQQVGEYGPRSFAVMGLTQGFRVNERWSADATIDRSATLDDSGAVEPQLNPNVPPASGSLNEDFTAVSLGATRRGDSSTLVSRMESRDADSEDRLGLMLGWHRDVREGIAYGFDARLFDSDFSNGSALAEGDVRYSLAYRPVTSNWIHLNRLEYKFDEQTDTLGADNRSRKLINNWKGNYMPARGHQLSLGYGVKYAVANFDGVEYDGVTHYLGSEYRYDISEGWDLGLSGSTLLSADAGANLYAYGISTGWNLGKDLWLSIGYNFDGFEDEDFSLAEYTAKGAYLKLRFKFDQDTLKLNQ
jgi:uncharacterized repeat protein (TIGR01451 family)